jgi:CHAT domain-containing protein
MRALKTFDLGPERWDEALRMIDATIAQARAVGDFDNATRAMVTRARMMVEAAPREEAKKAFQDLLEGIERLREIQPEPEIRARHFMVWRSSYQDFVDFLVEYEIELAFQIAERGRSRMLLDALESSGIQPDPDKSGPLEGERSEILQAIAGIQRRLMEPELSEEQREDNLKELVKLENEESGLRDRMARLGTPDGEHGDPEFARLSEVQQTLGPDQAMLYFELREARADKDVSRANGPSFVLALTRDTVSRHELPSSQEIAAQVDILGGLLLEEEASLGRPTARLFQDLLGEGMRSVPDDTKRLVIVPDGPLHRLPFETLREPDQVVPLGVRYAISYVPSATAWMRWKRSVVENATDRVLSLADPELGSSGIDSELSRKNPWASGLTVGPLPFARREARDVADLGGKGSLLLQGAGASESALKDDSQADRYRVVHFATHAVLDHHRPERSAILLVPGSDQEDGLLQMREIAALEFNDSLVILSACSSATGEELGGEGVMGLAHAFFRAGARTVVAASHPLRDDETAHLMSSFARRLGRGLSVAEALADARREMVEDGLPARAWAAVVVLGDGDYRPFEGREGFRAFYVVLGAVLFLLGTLWLLRRFIHQRREAASSP